MFEDTKRLIRIRKSKKERQHNGQKKKDKERQHNSQKKRDKERQHNGQKKKGKERQHNDQKKKDKERQHNCQAKKDKARQHNGQKKKDKGTNNDLKKIHIQQATLSLLISVNHLFLHLFFSLKKKCYYSYIVGVNFIGGGNTSTKRKSPTCHKIVEVEYGTIVI